MQENHKLLPDGAVSVSDAVAVLKKFKAPKFDQTVELAFNLGIDPTHADQLVRGSVALPNGVGKSKRVIAFCAGDNAEAAKEAGAVEVGTDELVKKIEGGWMDFDVAVATPDMMRSVSKLGRVLGPRGLMPSPKAGTVTKDIANAVKEYGAGKIEFRNDKSGNIHAPVGQMSFAEDKLVENIEFLISTVSKARPAAAKGEYMKRTVISGTMTPGVEINCESE